jgi:hypothetical protein
VIPLRLTMTRHASLSLFRQGREGEAWKLATAAAAQMKPFPKDELNPLAGDADLNDLILWLAYKEAKAMNQWDAAPAVSDTPKRK